MSKKKIVLGFLPGLVAGLAAVLLLSGVASSRTMTFQAGCNNDYFDANPVSRDTARDYAYGAVYEGYQWGGGCWNYDNVDSAPNDPPQTYTGGEGGDCSGFTYKSWWEKSTESDSGFRYHYALQNVHGPYDAARFKNGDGAPNITLAKSSTVYMDAFASTSHIGMIYYANTAYNEDRMVEAKCESCGTFTWPRTYRGDSSYSAVRRTGW
jgi:hypothetical protein